MLQVSSLVLFVLVFSLVSPLTIAFSGWTRTYQGEDMDILTPYSVVQTLDSGYATAIFVYLRRYDNEVGLLRHL